MSGNDQSAPAKKRPPGSLPGPPRPAKRNRPAAPPSAPPDDGARAMVRGALKEAKLLTYKSTKPAKKAEKEAEGLLAAGDRRAAEQRMEALVAELRRAKAEKGETASRRSSESQSEMEAPSPDLRPPGTARSGSTDAFEERDACSVTTEVEDAMDLDDASTYVTAPLATPPAISVVAPPPRPLAAAPTARPATAPSSAAAKNMTSLTCRRFPELIPYPLPMPSPRFPPVNAPLAHPTAPLPAPAEPISPPGEWRPATADAAIFSTFPELQGRAPTPPSAGERLTPDLEAAMRAGFIREVSALAAPSAGGQVIDAAYPNEAPAKPVTLRRASDASLPPIPLLPVFHPELAGLCLPAGRTEAFGGSSAVACAVWDPPRVPVRPVSVSEARDAQLAWQAGAGRVVWREANGEASDDGDGEGSEGVAGVIFGGDRWEDGQGDGGMREPEGGWFGWQLDV